MKRQLIAFAFLLAGCLFAHAKDTVLKGLRITPVDSTVIESFADDMNFCFATRFSDGQIHLEHSKGVHTVTEYGCMDFSHDNGRTWENNLSRQLFGASCFENLQGEKVRLSCWDTAKGTAHTLHIYTMDASGAVAERAVAVELPYASSLLLHRSVIRLGGSEKLLATAYGLKQGAPKHHVLLLESGDDGITWHFLADVAEDREAVTKEGPNEPTIAQLKDGTLFCAWRDGGPLKFSYSHDGGRSWEPESVYEKLDGAVAPQALVLSSGALVVITGRPNLFLLIDPTGTGREFRKMELYHGSGSSYASVMETAPNELLTIHDESNFGGGFHSPFSRVVADRYRIAIEEDGDGECLDPRGKGFTLFYSAVAGLLPFEVEDFKPCLYLKHVDDKALIWSEIVQIPERPQPILRLQSHGNEKLQHNTAWPLVMKELPADTEKMTIECEFRLMEPQLASPQLSIGGIVGYDANGKGANGYANFANDRLQVLTADGMKAIPCDLASGFHAFRMELDYRRNSFRIYKDGAETPLYDGPLVKSVYAPRVSFGDGATDVYGTVDISFFGCKY